MKEKWKKNPPGRQHTALSIPSAARQISAMPPRGLNNDDSMVLGDRCIPQLNDTKALNVFSSQSFYQFFEIIRFIHLCLPMGEHIPDSGVILSPTQLNILTHQYIMSTIFGNCCQKTKQRWKRQTGRLPGLDLLTHFVPQQRIAGINRPQCFLLFRFVLMFSFLFFSRAAHIKVAPLCTALPHTHLSFEPLKLSS